MDDDQGKSRRAMIEENKAPMNYRSVVVVDDRLDSRDLFGKAREIIIGHGEDRYRLRLTAQNKLILTK